MNSSRLPRLSVVALSVAASLACPASAFAESPGWTIEKLSGRVYSNAIDGRRSELNIGDVLEPGVTMVTGERSRVMLRRGTETMVVASASVVAISEHPTEDLSTTVLEKVGSVTFDVEKRNVQHFSVETPVLAAVVKGTHFTVSIGRGAGKVAVSRGTVQVTALARGETSDVTAGQQARVGARGLAVSGKGQHAGIHNGPPRAAVVSGLAALTTAATITAAELASVVATDAAPAPSYEGLFSAVASFGGVSQSAAASGASASGPSRGGNRGENATASNAVGATSASAGAGSGPNASRSYGKSSTGTGAPGGGSAGTNQANASTSNAGSHTSGGGSSTSNGTGGSGNNSNTSVGTGNGSSTGNGQSGTSNAGTGGNGNNSGPSAGPGNGSTNSGSGQSSNAGTGTSGSGSSSTSNPGKSDNGKGNAGTPGNGGANNASGGSNNNGSPGNSKSGKSDNGKGNAGTPGNGGANKSNAGKK